MQIDVIGGVYAERCVRPHWDATYGSAGRAACAIATSGTEVRLHAYMSESAEDAMRQLAFFTKNLHLHPHTSSNHIAFEYLHDLATPRIIGRPAAALPALTLCAERVVRFGMLEAEAIVDAEWAVYDPQNMGATEGFSKNGSRANHLALVLNLWEARQLAQLPTGKPEECARSIGAAERAEVVIVKMGPLGALVWTPNGVYSVPSYQSASVWKIGSGDCFVGAFAAAWMGEGLPPAQAAQTASFATAYYCETRGFATHEQLDGYAPIPLIPSGEFKEGATRQVYLAGPFFDLSQIWMVEQARINLTEVGLKVFSPFHDIGLGSADDVVQKDIDAIKESDILFAILDGGDAGTLFEVGYAVSLGIPVVVYSERESDEALKMMVGSGCKVHRNYASAVYAALWLAAER